jgi:hypothetical protein
MKKYGRIALPPTPYTFPKGTDLIVAMATAPDPHVHFGSRLCENSEIQIARRNSVSISSILEISSTASMRQERAIENIFLLALGLRTFSHSLDPKRTCGSGAVAIATIKSVPFGKV